MPAVQIAAIVTTMNDAAIPSRARRMKTVESRMQYLWRGRVACVVSLYRQFAQYQRHLVLNTLKDPS